MKASLILLLFALLFVPKALIAQNLEEYKYVIVPIKYDFLSEKDQYQLNSLTEFLFEKYGFTAILEGESFPQDLQENPCSALRADVHSDSGMFSFVTKVKLTLTNCSQEVVFESKEGRSRLKKYKFSYQEALRDAFSSVEKLQYSYSPSAKKNEEEAKTLPVPKKEVVVENKKGNHFVWNDKEFILEEKGKTLVLKQVGTEKPKAFLNQTSKGNYIYRSDAVQGTAYFDENGNLKVEYFDAKAGKMKKIVFEWQP